MELMFILIQYPNDRNLNLCFSHQHNNNNNNTIKINTTNLTHCCSNEREVSTRREKKYNTFVVPNNNNNCPLIEYISNSLLNLTEQTLSLFQSQYKSLFLLFLLLHLLSPCSSTPLSVCLSICPSAMAYTAMDTFHRTSTTSTISFTLCFCSILLQLIIPAKGSNLSFTLFLLVPYSHFCRLRLISLQSKHNAHKNRQSWWLLILSSISSHFVPSHRSDGFNLISSIRAFLSTLNATDKYTKTDTLTHTHTTGYFTLRLKFKYHCDRQRFVQSRCQTQKKD